MSKKSKGVKKWYYVNVLLMTVFEVDCSHWTSPSLDDVINKLLESADESRSQDLIRSWTKT